MLGGAQVEGRDDNDVDVAGHVGEGQVVPDGPAHQPVAHCLQKPETRGDAVERAHAERRVRNAATAQGAI